MMRFYSVYDRVPGEYSPPFPAKNDDVALRTFEQFLSSTKNASHSDFELYELFDMDMDSGSIGAVAGSPRRVNVKIEGAQL